MARMSNCLHGPVFLAFLFYLSGIYITSAAPTEYSDDVTTMTTPSVYPSNKPTNASATTESAVGFSISKEVKASSLQKATVLGPPIPQRGTFTLKDEDSQVCLKAKFVAVFKIYYKSQLSEQEEASISLPANASVSGKCKDSDGTSILTLQWNAGKYLLNFTFKEMDGRWIGDKIQLTYDARNNPDFDKAVDPDVCVVQTNKDTPFFDTKLGWSRTCKSEHDITLESDKEERVVMQITELRLQPFGLVNGTFGTEAHCKADMEKKNSNTASLVVGLTLAVFTLIVIIGYAVGRKTGYISERPGYSTME